MERIILTPSRLSNRYPIGWMITGVSDSEITATFRHKESGMVLTAILDSDSRIRTLKVSFPAKPASLSKTQRALFPAAEFRDLAPPLESRMRSELFSLGFASKAQAQPSDSSGAPYVCLSWAINNALQYLTYEAHIGLFSPSPHIIRARLSSVEQRERFLMQLFHGKNLSSSLIRPVTEVLPELSKDGAIETLTYLLCHLESFSPRERGAVGYHLLDRLMAAVDQADFASVFDRINPGCFSLGAEIPRSFASATANLLIRRMGDPGRTDYARRENVRNFFSAVRYFPAAELKAGVSEAARFLLEKGRDHELLEGLALLAGKATLPFAAPAPVHIPPLSNELAERLIAGVKDSYQAAQLVQLLDLFPNFDRRNFIGSLDELHWLEGLSNQLYQQKHLPFETARKLVVAGYSSAVASHPGAFSLSPSEEIALVGMLVGKSDSILSDILTRPDLDKFEASLSLASYKKAVGLACSKAYCEFRDFKRAGDLNGLAAFVAHIRRLPAALICSDPLPRELSVSPYLPMMLEAVYPNHSHAIRDAMGRDRSDDIREFIFAPHYELDLSEGGRVERAVEHPLDEQALSRILDPVSFSLDTLKPHSRFGRNAMLRACDEHIGACAPNIPSVARTLPQRMCALLIQGEAGMATRETVKKAVFLYHFANSHDLDGFVNGTIGRASEAKNREYASMLAYQQLFSDDVAETLREVLEAGFQNQDLTRYFREHIAEAATQRYEACKTDLMNRSRGDDIGITPRLLNTLHMRWNSASGKRRYELVENAVASAQRKVQEVVRLLTGEELDSDSIHLEDYSFSAVDRRFKERLKSEDERTRILSACHQDIEELFAGEIDWLSRELKLYKTEDMSDARLLRLDAVFTKNAPSFLARGVAGVCVAGDAQQWALPNYFQLVLRDPVTGRCEGLLLLHHYTQGEEKILTASFNPTSTFLLKVNERQLFRELMRVLISFARDNGFSVIACSKNPTIRTNRSGEFQVELKDRIQEVNRSFTLERPQPFSFSPSYMQEELDVLWRR